MNNKLIYFVFVLYISIAIVLGGKVKGSCDTQGEAKLKYREEFKCLAVLISQTYALTAAQCIKDKTGYFLELGQDCSAKKPDIKVSEITIHEQYDEETKVNNIAALKFDSITLDDSIAIPTLAAQVPKTGTHCTFYEYTIKASKQYYGNEYEHVNAVKVRINSDSTCNKIFNRYLNFTGKNGLFCAYGRLASIVNVDGGPLLCNKELVGIGILSMGSSVSRDAFTSIPYHSEWIQKVMN